MTIDVPSAVVVTVAVAAGGFLLRLTVFDAIHRLERGAKDQGRRLGDLESWTEAHDAVENFKHRRKLTAPLGHPTREDDTPP